MAVNVKGLSDGIWVSGVENRASEGWQLLLHKHNAMRQTRPKSGGETV